jgi:hypothetical protein
MPPARAFGHNWDSDIPLTLFDRAESEGGPAILVRRRADLAERETIRSIPGGVLCPGGFRFRWGDQATFDIIGGTRVDYVPGTGWADSLPAAFYSTIAALTVAWRGYLALHASAVEIDGSAVLIAGRSGAGKSTLAAGLLRCGARLIGDDLTVIDPATARVTVGRPAMRLHRDTASTLRVRSLTEVPDDPRGKVLVQPDARYTGPELPVGAIVFLDEISGKIRPEAALALLGVHRFRPRWQDVLPQQAGRMRALISLAGSTSILGLPAIRLFSPSEVVDRCQVVLAALGR